LDIICETVGEFDRKTVGHCFGSEVTIEGGVSIVEDNGRSIGGGIRNRSVNGVGLEEEAIEALVTCHEGVTGTIRDTFEIHTFSNIVIKTLILITNRAEVGFSEY
jgi:hypothetical protein